MCVRQAFRWPFTNILSLHLFLFLSLKTNGRALDSVQEEPDVAVQMPFDFFASEDFCSGDEPVISLAFDHLASTARLPAENGI